MAKKKSSKKIKPRLVKKIKGLKQQVKIEKTTGKPAKITIKKQVFGEAPEEKIFYLADGKKLKNLMQLTAAFEDMTEDVFRHHVNDMKNDFSNWINDVFKDEELAKDIKDIKDRTDAEIRMLKHFVKKLTAAT